MMLYLAMFGYQVAVGVKHRTRVVEFGAVFFGQRAADQIDFVVSGRFCQLLDGLALLERLAVLRKVLDAIRTIKALLNN